MVKSGWHYKQQTINNLKSLIVKWSKFLMAAVIYSYWSCDNNNICDKRITDVKCFILGLPIYNAWQLWEYGPIRPLDRMGYDH